MKRLAIDPGDKHVGWAYQDEDGAVTADEWSPTDCCNQVVFMMTRNMVDELIVEEWVLYPKERTNQTFKSMLSSQLIGALKLIAYWFRVPVVEQGAYIKKPTRAQLRKRGIKQVGPVIHARDAELHLYHRVLREK